MEIRLTYHAQLRMEQRVVSRPQIERVIEDPERVALHPRRVIYDGIIDSRTLRVVTTRESGVELVITVWWIEDQGSNVRAV